MNNWNESELKFRCERLSVRLERLAQGFLQMADLGQTGACGDEVLDLVRECKSFLELTAIDLDVDNAYELAQMQRQLSRWHFDWAEVWGDDGTRSEIVTIAKGWVEQVRQMAGILV
jgi:hypothetical protein